MKISVLTFALIFSQAAFRRLMARARTQPAMRRNPTHPIRCQQAQAA
ncbi:MAG: hypothetical protein M0Q54_04235 [Pigmentiphaga sp.]|nr:hypothetical protein [Pigmentiphaga sp.]